jgi:hypothetical protein
VPPHTISIGNDGILRVAFVGDPRTRDAAAFFKDFSPFLEAATEEEPLHIIIDGSRLGKTSASARKTLLGINRDPRVGKIAVLGAGRYMRVLVGFILKATRRDNIRLFAPKHGDLNAEKEAIAWLKE